MNKVLRYILGAVSIIFGLWAFYSGYMGYKALAIFCWIIFIIAAIPLLNEKDAKCDKDEVEVSISGKELSGMSECGLRISDRIHDKDEKDVKTAI